MIKLSILLSIVVLGLFSSQQVFADTIMLTGDIRDFCNPTIVDMCTAHPNFESGISGLVTGMVSSTLGFDGKPVYTAAGTGATTNAADFDQWYNDVVGVNTKTSLMITLDNTITADPNVYTFDGSPFFPIDGILFGDQGRIHNYHFTFEIHTQFTYQGGEMFAFTGDDDLWVFINDELVVDVGGVHPALSDSVDLDDLGLTIGEIYNFDVFHAERHTDNSNFRIDTSIELMPNMPVGGTLIPIDTTALLLAGVQTNALWIMSALAVIGSVAFGAVYINSKKN